MQGEFFETSEIRRDATFFGPYRIKLSRDWSDSPRALVIGCNPSNADALRDDPTSRWWNKWFEQAGFGGYDAANLYPFCTASPKECRAIVEGNSAATRHAIHDINMPALIEMAISADQVFVCWGAIAWDNSWVAHISENLMRARSRDPILWCWGKTMSGAPKHPLARGKQRITNDQRAATWSQ